MSSIATQTTPFALKKSVNRDNYDYSYELFNKTYFYWLDLKRRIKVIEDSYRKIIVVLDENGEDSYYAVFTTNTSKEEQQYAIQASLLCNKLVKSLDDGKYENKELMNEILTYGVGKFANTKNYEFNLPFLEHETEVWEQSGVESLDLNNAFARALWNAGLVSLKMYTMLVECKKQVRLRVLGMLAKQQQIKTINKDGEVDFQYSYKTKYHALFRFAEVKVANDMVYMKQILTDKYFVFYWVDGIYYLSSTPQKIKTELQRFLNGDILPKSNYDYKFEKVPYLKHYKEGNLYYLYLTKENSNGVPEPKLYSLARAWLKEESIEVL